MRRRDFITLVGGVSLAGRGPLAARAQEAAMPVIGYLSQGSLEFDAVRLTGFRRGLNEGELVINLNTAKSLGIAVPQALLARADEVIE